MTGWRVLLIVARARWRVFRRSPRAWWQGEDRNEKGRYR